MYQNLGIRLRDLGRNDGALAIDQIRARVRDSEHRRAFWHCLIEDAERTNDLRIGIGDMQEALMKLNAKQQEVGAPVPAWFPVAGVVFAAVTVLFLMYLLVSGVPAANKRTFDLLMAFCAASSAAFLGGSAVARGAIPFFRDSPIQFSTWGGIGIFVVVYLILRYA